jgi:hypothetical protein
MKEAMRIPSFLLLVALGAPILAPAQDSIPFDPESDELCFRNHDPELADAGRPLLGWWGKETGVCQGMDGIMAAFLERARFRPELPRAGASETEALLGRVLARHAAGCGSRVDVPGYASLKELCADHRKLFLAASIDYNASIGLREIAAQMIEFLWLRDSAVGEGYRARLHEEIGKLRARLQQGRAPLLLIYRHTLLVLAVTAERDASGTLLGERFLIKDPNRGELVERRVAYAPDGLPEAESAMLWDVTPDRGSSSCE